MDTFFTIYFILVGGLFLLNLIYKIIVFLKGEEEDWQLQLADDVLTGASIYIQFVNKNHY